MTAPRAVDSLSDLVQRASSLSDRGERTILGITGAPGAGKSTLVEILLSRLGTDVGHLPMDGFHLADAQLDRLGRRDRKGAPDTFDVDGYVATLARVRSDAGSTIYVPGFERDLEQPIAAALVIEPTVRLVVTEGNYLLLPHGGWEQVRPLLAEVWFVSVDDALRVERLIRRHEEFGKSPAAAREWVERNDEANAALVAATRGTADVVVRV